MKQIIFLFLIFISAITSAQELDQKLLKINRQLDSIIHIKSMAFQRHLDTINLHLQQGYISPEDADFQKRQLAKRYAENVDYTVYKLTTDLKRIAKGRQVVDSSVNQDGGYTIHRIKLYRKRRYDYTIHHNKNTFAYFYLAAGVNNIVHKDQLESIEDSPYSILDSRFFELGIDWKTNIRRHKLLLKYGFSFTWNTLKPTGNYYHIVENGNLELVEHTADLSRSKLRSIWLKFPLALEINLPESNKQHLRLSAGIYGKVRCTTKQKLTFNDGSGENEQVIKGDFTMPNFNYGLSAEVGGNSWSIYANYDLNELFKNKNMNLLNVGVKLEL